MLKNDDETYSILQTGSAFLLTIISDLPAGDEREDLLARQMAITTQLMRAMGIEPTMDFNTSLARLGGICQEFDAREAQ